MRKTFAALLVSVLIFVMAMISVNAAIIYTGDWTATYTWDAVPANSAGYLVEQGSGSVTAATDAEGTNVINVTGTNARFAKNGLTAPTATEVELDVVSGSATISWNKTYAGNALHVRVYANGDYHIVNGHHTISTGNVASGTYTGEKVTVTMCMDSTYVQITVNGTVHEILRSGLAYFATDYNVLQVMTFAADSEANVYSFKIGAAALPPPQTSNSPVSVVVNRTYDEETVYSIELTFGNFDFTYTPAKYENYDPVTHQYLNVTPAAWEGNDGVNNVIHVTNRSNAAVQVDVTCYIHSNLNGVTIDWDGDLSKTLASALNRNKPDSLMVTATVGGEPNKNYIDDGSTRNRIGAITVTVVPA